MAKRKRGLEEAVDRALEERLGAIDTVGMGIMGDDDDSGQIAENLKATVPRFGEDVYLKIYRTRPLSQGRTPVFLDEVEDPRGIKDLEIFVRNRAIEKDWGSGEYLVIIVQKLPSGEVIHKERVRFEVNCPEKAQETRIEEKSPQQSQSIMTQLREATDLINTIKASMPQTSNVDPNEYVRTQLEMFKSGMEMGKNNGGNGNGNGHNNQPDIVTIISALKQLNNGNEKPKESEETSILKAVELLKGLGVINPPKQSDTFAEIKKLAELGLIKLGGQENKEDNDMLSQVSKVVELAKLLPALTGNSSGSDSPWIKLIEVVGPSVPKIFDNISAGIKEVAEVQKMKLSARLNGLLPKRNEQPGSPPSNPSPNPQLPEPIQGSNPHDAASPPVNPVISKILSAIAANDRAFYPELEKLLTIYVGNHIVGALLDEQVSIEQFLQTLVDTLKEPRLNTPQAKMYLEGFLSTFMIVVKCEKCGKDFDTTRQDWDGDPDHKCECGGELKVVGEEKEEEKEEEKVEG